MSDTIFNDAKVIDAVQALEASDKKTIVILDQENRICGTITDGDIRRCLLAGGSLSSDISLAWNETPLIANDAASAGELMRVVRNARVRCLPVVDADGRFVKLIDSYEIFSDISEGAIGEVFDFAVIMAGGEGVRLRPYTEHLPKPMVPIGGMPIIERQINRLKAANIKRVYLSVNYLSGVIEDYFRDGSDFGVEISYLHETEKLGTGGSLSLLPDVSNKPILVMNGDVLSNIDYHAIGQFHHRHQPKISVAAVNHEITIPFGVIEADGPFVTGFAEKPVKLYFCNAGIYVLSPELLGESLPEAPFNMTDIVEKYLRSPKQVAVFPIHEYWSDIGTPDDLERARALFETKD